MLVKETALRNELSIEKNDNYDAILELSTNSKKTAWWRCEKGHVWLSTIANRSLHGCPYCSGRRAINGQNDLKTLYPNLINEWNYKKNSNITPETLLPNSSKKVWWICSLGHEWLAKVYTRTRGSGCPFCSGRMPISGVNDFKTLFPEIAKEWDYNKNNNIDPSKIGRTSHKKVWWKCEQGHEWRAEVAKRTARKDGCPYCSGRYCVSGDNDLATKRPDLIAEWDYEKNQLNPSDICEFTHKKAWWICSNKKHSYLAQISDRTSKNSGCPYCSGRKPIKGETDLATVFPYLAAEWNVKKNNNKHPSDYTSKSNVVVWWSCKYGHEWRAAINNRAAGKGCPICAEK